ncbi:MAG: hypothetical protein KJ061_18255 [Vicinamibacteraceae bacterium]|nr:hypothetical protein [Vicinamibacteraceae bacterium]
MLADWVTDGHLPASERGQGLSRREALAGRVGIGAAEQQVDFAFGLECWVGVTSRVIRLTAGSQLKTEN